MNEATIQRPFVILFRQNPPDLNAAEKQRRAAETAEWAAKQNAAGHRLTPHILEPEIIPVDHPGENTSTDCGVPVTAILFLEARDVTEAKAVAESHPALRYRASAEIRAWVRPNAPAKN
jgi:hypothetical protein